MDYVSLNFGLFRLKITLITMGNVVQNDGVEAYSMNVPLQETFYCAKETKI